MLKCLVMAFAFFVAAVDAASAQDDRRMNTVVVTATKADNQVSAPNVYRRVRADFVEVAVTVQSGTRDLEEREQELKVMFDRLKAAATKQNGYSLLGGVTGRSSAPIETVAFHDVLRNFGTNGQFQLTLSVDTRPGESFDALMVRANKFLEGIRAKGRAEAFLANQQFLGIRRTDEHRNDLLQDLQKEVRMLGTLFHPAIITIDGLDQRVITQPSGPLELQIFVPYEIVIESGRKS